MALSRYNLICWTDVNPQLTHSSLFVKSQITVIHHEFEHKAILKHIEHIGNVPMVKLLNEMQAKLKTVFIIQTFAHFSIQVQNSSKPPM